MLIATATELYNVLSNTVIVSAKQYGTYLSSNIETAISGLLIYDMQFTIYTYWVPQKPKK